MVFPEINQPKLGCLKKWRLLGCLQVAEPVNCKGREIYFFAGRRPLRRIGMAGPICICRQSCARAVISIGRATSLERGFENVWAWRMRKAGSPRVRPCAVRMLTLRECGGDFRALSGQSSRQIARSWAGRPQGSARPSRYDVVARAYVLVGGGGKVTV